MPSDRPPIHGMPYRATQSHPVLIPCDMRPIPHSTGRRSRVQSSFVCRHLPPFYINWLIKEATPTDMRLIPYPTGQHSRVQSVSLGAGGAVVMQSSAEDEWEEVLLKARPVMRAIDMWLAGS